MTAHAPVLPPLSIYLHFPWCVRKCPYCDFNSHAVNGELPEAAYLGQLCADIDREAPQWAGRAVQTIFLGGGTPSLVSAAAIAAVLAKVRDAFVVATDAEITLEANPGAVEADRFEGFRAAGVNRLSIGVQSFDDAALQRLGRIHDASAARRAIAQAQRAGFRRINVDLMHGLPDQTIDAALSDLNVALASGVEHLSWYQLTIEPNTAFFRAPPTLPDEDQLEEIEARGVELLQAHAFDCYEVSAWRKGDNAARHNLNYWQFGDYVGIGAGAHGKQSAWRDGQLQVARYQKSRAPRDYLLDCGRKNCQQIAAPDLPFEFLLNALRLRDGVDESVFAARTGLSVAALQPALTQLRERGLMRSDRLAATALGWRYLDSLLEQFIPATDDSALARTNARRANVNALENEVSNVVTEGDSAPLESGARPLRWS